MMVPRRTPLPDFENAPFPLAGEGGVGGERATGMES